MKQFLVTELKARESRVMSLWELQREFSQLIPSVLNLPGLKKIYITSEKKKYLCKEVEDA